LASTIGIAINFKGGLVSLDHPPRTGPVTTLEWSETRLLRAPQTFLGLIQWLCPLDLNCALWVLGVWRPTQT
jgi:hypothetical protein